MKDDLLQVCRTVPTPRIEAGASGLVPVKRVRTPLGRSEPLSKEVVFGPHPAGALFHALGIESDLARVARVIDVDALDLDRDLAQFLGFDAQTAWGKPVSIYLEGESRLTSRPAKAFQLGRIPRFTE
jgi:hypothetical protein